jgi:hypothetical protein
MNIDLMNEKDSTTVPKENLQFFSACLVPCLVCLSACLPCKAYRR